MKAVCKKLFSLMLVAILLVSAVPFQVSADETQETTEMTEAIEVVAVAETTEAVTEAASEEEVEAEAVTTPAVAAEVVNSEARYIEFQVIINGVEYRVGDLIKTNIGSKAKTPKESAVLKVVNAVLGASEGYKLARWELDSTGETFTSDTTINLSMATVSGTTENTEKYDPKVPIIRVNAIVESVVKTITLDAAKGTIANKKFQVVVGQPYGYCAELPIPTRTGYSFNGWFKADGTRVENTTIVNDLSDLTASWTTGRYTVIYKGYTASGWAEVGFGSFIVDNNSILKTEYNNFPTDAQIKSMFNFSGWTIDGWEYSNDGGDTWKEFKAGSTKIVGDTIIRPLYKKNITLYACDAGNTTRSLQVTLGKNFPILPHPGTREGYAFVGWYMEAAAQNLVSTKDNLSNVSVHPIVTADIQALYAGWDNAKIVYLYIHTNGNTKEHTKLVRYYDVPVSGFDLTDIDLYDIFPNYGNYDDKNDEKWGWYNEAQWENFCMNKHKYETTEYVDAEYLKNDDVHEFYIMLINNGTTNNNNNNNYNDNKNTVDSSNPTTGDDIFVAVTIMAVSACAVLLIFMNKKRFIK